MSGPPERKRKRGEPMENQKDGQKDGAAVETSEIAKAFQGFAAYLTDKQDRHERLVKLSRDVTIQSKRVIFTLQRINGEDEAVLKEAEEGLKRIQTDIARELKGNSPQLYWRAYSPGLQEYIEAATFLWYLKNKTLCSLQELNAQLVFADDVALRISPDDYMLGIADLTGELMRFSINSIGSHPELTHTIAAIVRLIDTGMRRLSPQSMSRDLANKLPTLTASLGKIEDACYTLRVRGSELPAGRLGDALDDRDEKMVFTES